MSQVLPKGWTSCEIGEVAQVVGGATPPSKDPTNFDGDGGVPWITPADLSGYRETYIGRGVRNLSAKGFAACSAAMLPAGTVLFSSRAPVGYVAIATNPVCTNQGFKSFVLPEGLDSRFVYYYLRHMRPIAEQRATGTTFKELSGAAASRLPLKIAPTNEQQRIADKLDAVLARVDACRERLDRVPDILKRFREALLAFAISGELTKDWRSRRAILQTGNTLVDQVRAQYKHFSAENGAARVKDAIRVRAEEISEEELRALLSDDLPEGWGIVRAAEVVQPGAEIVYGIVQPGPKLDEGVPYVRGKDIENGRILVDQLMKTSLEIAEKYARAALEGGDILLGIIRATKVARVPEELHGANITQGTARFRPSSALRSKFLALALEAPATQRWLHKHYRGIDMPGLNLADVRRVPVPIPSLEEQDEIIRRVDSIFAYAESVEARYTTARAQVDALPPALLAKAFRGELLPQDPNDEPASVLLERIRAARAAAPAKLRGRKGAKGRDTPKLPELLMLSRKAIQPTHLTSILKERGPLTAESLWSASQLDIDDFYDQLKDEESRGMLRENRSQLPSAPRILEAVE